MRGSWDDALAGGVVDVGMGEAWVRRQDVEQEAEGRRLRAEREARELAEREREPEGA